MVTLPFFPPRVSDAQSTSMRLRPLPAHSATPIIGRFQSAKSRKRGLHRQRIPRAHGPLARFQPRCPLARATVWPLARPLAGLQHHSDLDGITVTVHKTLTSVFHATSRSYCNISSLAFSTGGGTTGTLPFSLSYCCGLWQCSLTSPARRWRILWRLYQ